MNIKFSTCTAIRAFTAFVFLTMINITGYCGFFSRSNPIDSIQLIYNAIDLRLPGEDFSIGVIGFFSDGKVKRTINLEKGTMFWNRFSVEVVGGYYFAPNLRILSEV